MASASGDPGTSGEGAAGYYAVIGQFHDNRDWMKFARVSLKLPESEIGNIQEDFQSDVQEQKYRMILKWKKTLGDEATPELLEQLKEEFVTQPSNNARPVQQSVITQSDNRYRIIMEVFQKLSNEDTDKLCSIYSNKIPGSKTFQNTAELMFYLVNDKLWDEGTNKLVALRDDMKEIDREDICREIDAEIAQLDVQRNAGDQTDARPFVEEPQLEEPVNPEIDVPGSDGEGIVQQLVAARRNREASQPNTENLPSETASSRTTQKQPDSEQAQVNVTVEKSTFTGSVLNIGSNVTVTTNHHYNASNAKKKEKKDEKAGNSKRKDNKK